MKQICFEVYSKEELLKDIDELIKKHFATINKSFEEDTLKTHKEVATYFSISMSTLRQWIKTGILPSYRIGTKVRFKKKEVVAALKPRQFRR